MPQLSHPCPHKLCDAKSHQQGFHLFLFFLTKLVLIIQICSLGLVSFIFDAQSLQFCPNAFNFTLPPLSSSFSFPVYFHLNFLFTFLGLWNTGKKLRFKEKTFFYKNLDKKCSNCVMSFNFSQLPSSLVTWMSSQQKSSLPFIKVFQKFPVHGSVILNRSRK